MTPLRAVFLDIGDTVMRPNPSWEHIYAIAFEEVYPGYGRRLVLLAFATGLRINELVPDNDGNLHSALGQRGGGRARRILGRLACSASAAGDVSDEARRLSLGPVAAPRAGADRSGRSGGLAALLAREHDRHLPASTTGREHQEPVDRRGETGHAQHYRVGRSAKSHGRPIDTRARGELRVSRGARTFGQLGYVTRGAPAGSAPRPRPCAWQGSPAGPRTRR